MPELDFKTELQDVFVDEAQQLVERIEQIVVELEQPPRGDETPQLQKRLRRTLHTLKGAASALEIEPIVRICHVLEEGLDQFRRADRGLDTPAFDAIHRAIEYVERWIEGRDDEPLEPVINQIEAAFDASAPSGENDEAGGSGDESRGDGQPAAPRDEPPGPKDAAGGSEDSPPAPGRHRRSAVRVDSAKLDDLQAVAGQLVVLNLRQRKDQNRIEQIRDGLADVLSRWQMLYGRLRELADTLPTSDWRRLERHASEIALGLKASYQHSYDYARRGVGQVGRLERISEALEDGLRTIRMQPLGPFFDGFARVVRNAARSEDKQVRFQSEGRHIEVDRAVLDQLREPLIHLVRNAVAHGIEPPEQRRRCGKAPVGRVVLRARPAGERVRLTVCDDGAGIDAARIRQRAVQAEIAPSMEAAARRPLIELLTHPGFSTREDTDEVAGRGIGLEAVDAVVADLGGTLQVDTHRGEGTEFHLTIPTSITTSEGLIAQVGGFRLGIQLDAIERVIRIGPDQIHSIDEQRVIYHDEQPVTLAPLAELVGVVGAAPQMEDDEKLPALILRHGDQRLAAVVDALPGQMPMVVKPLGPQFEEVRHLAGGAIQADGSILPVIEHRALFRRASGMEQPVRRSGASRRPVSPPKTRRESTPDATGAATILVVDDSITTRTLERNILEAAGHRVLAAKDGAQALEILRNQAADATIDLVVTDLDMPRVNGFELCRAIRDGSEFQLPVVIVTSKGADEEIRRGMEAGADAYIVKGNFDQDHFMATVNRFVS